MGFGLGLRSGLGLGLGSGLGSGLGLALTLTLTLTLTSVARSTRTSYGGILFRPSETLTVAPARGLTLVYVVWCPSGIEPKLYLRCHGARYVRHARGWYAWRGRGGTYRAWCPTGRVALRLRHVQHTGGPYVRHGCSTLRLRVLWRCAFIAACAPWLLYGHVSTQRRTKKSTHTT